MHLGQQYTISPRFEGGSEMEWKGTKKIILEHSSFSLFGSFNSENKKFIFLFGSLSALE